MKGIRGLQNKLGLVDILKLIRLELNSYFFRCENVFKNKDSEMTERIPNELKH